MLRRNSLLFLFTLLLALPSPAFADEALKIARSIPIQHNGRVKSFDSFSRQTVESITGRERWQRTDAVTVVLNALNEDKKIADMPWVLVNEAELRAALGLDAKERHFSYNDIFPSLAKIESLMKSAQQKRDLDKPTSPLEKAAESLYVRLVNVKDLITGEVLRVVPPVDESTEEWHSAYQKAAPGSAEFQKLVALYVKDKAAFTTAASDWIETVHETTKNTHRKTLQLEVLYNQLRPFQWAWVAYLLAFIFFTTFKKTRWGNPGGVTLVASAMLLHTLGLTLRVLVLQRPPVSNMYESMVYMNWAVMVFAVGFAVGTRKLIYLSAGSAISAMVMIYGSLLPIDANLEVLVPVLRSNYWLTIHVMTIVSSYGAFGLAMALGHRHLVLGLSKKFNKAAQEESGMLIYRVIQLGVLLLGIGTVLGGVWANESWGRFWGWDPKETWALITFLAYLVVVHLKYAKKINAHWLALTSIFGFFFVLMTWYGVNFVLGRGLHSYGFGSGGMNWILYYLAAELTFIAFILTRKTK